MFEAGTLNGRSGSARLSAEKVVKLFGSFKQDENCEIEEFMNLAHAGTATPCRFAFGTESREIKIASLIARTGSLKDVLSVGRSWGDRQ
jgi:hypothetical protein